MRKLAVAILLALTMPASAEDMNDANSILPGCKGTRGTQMWEQGRCAGFIEGLRYVPQSGRLSRQKHAARPVRLLRTD